MQDLRCKKSYTHVYHDLFQGLRLLLHVKIGVLQTNQSGFPAKCLIEQILEQIKFDIDVNSQQHAQQGTRGDPGTLKGIQIEKIVATYVSQTSYDHDKSGKFTHLGHYHRVHGASPNLFFF